jgi:hypothetical protein
MEHTNRHGSCCGGLCLGVFDAYSLFALMQGEFAVLTFAALQQEYE